MTDLTGIKFIKSDFLAPATVVCSADVYELIVGSLRGRLGAAVELERLKFSRGMSSDHNNFEPDNCNCRFCAQIAALEKELK